MPAQDLPLILLTNDDGYGAPGLVALEQALSRVARVVVVAPEVEQSACSHALSLHRALRLRRVSQDHFALDGTPADCVYVACYGGDRVLPRRPDLVLSGINRGLNLGLDIYYSGTVAAAREGAIRGVSGLAASADTATDLQSAARLCVRIALTCLRMARRSNTPLLLNVNIPPGKRWKVRAVTSGQRRYGEGVDFRSDPRGREYLWIGAPGVWNDTESGTDTEAFDRGEVGVNSLPLVPTEQGTHAVARQVVRLLGHDSSLRKKS